MMSFFSLVEQKYDDIYCSDKYSYDPQKQYRKAYIEACLALIKTEFDPNEREPEDGETILMVVTTTGRLNLVKFLVEAGADVNARDYDGISFALQEAARLGWQEIYDYLVPLTNPELVHIAQQSIAQGLAYQKRLNNRNKQVEILINSVNEGNLNEVMNCIDNGVDVNAIGFHYSNALHQACFSGHISIINVLLSAGANPNIKTEDGKGKTPLIISLNTIYYMYYKVDGTNTQLQITKILIEAGANINAIDANGDTALVYAIAKAKKRSIIFVLIEAGANINTKNNDGLTALMISCGGWVIPEEYLTILLESGANIDLRDKQGKTALMHAIREPKFLEEKTLQLEKVKLLIKAGANVNVQDNDRKTALSLAKEIGNTKIIELLIQAGAKED